MPVKRKRSDTVGLMLRLRESQRAALEKSAKGHGVSLNSEIVGRLELSFSEQDYIRRLESDLGGPAAYKMLMILGRAMAQAGGYAAALSGVKIAEWPGDPTAYAQAVRAAKLVLKALEPIGEPANLDPLKTEKGERQVGEFAARSVLDHIQIPDIRDMLQFSAKANEAES